MTYRQRKLDGSVHARPRRLNIEKAREIRRKYLRREAKQMQLALKYGVTQSTIAKVVAHMVHADRF